MSKSVKITMSKPVKFGLLPTGHEVAVVKDASGTGASLQLRKSRHVSKTAHYKWGYRAVCAAKKLVAVPEFVNGVKWL